MGGAEGKEGGYGGGTSSCNYKDSEERIGSASGRGQGRG